MGEKESQSLDIIPKKYRRPPFMTFQVEMRIKIDISHRISLFICGDESSFCIQFVEKIPNFSFNIEIYFFNQIRVVEYINKNNLMCL